MHKVLSGTLFFPNGTHGKQLIEQTQIIACHLLPSTTKYDRKIALPVSAFALRNCKRLAIGFYPCVTNTLQIADVEGVFRPQVPGMRTIISNLVNTRRRISTAPI